MTTRSLGRDDARCCGVKDEWDARGCGECLRQIVPPHEMGQWYTEPPPLRGGVCEYFLQADDENGGAN